MQIVKIPWAHIPVSVELDIPETDKLAMVRNQPINRLKTLRNENIFISDVNFECNNALILFSNLFL